MCKDRFEPPARSSHSLIGRRFPRGDFRRSKSSSSTHHSASTSGSGSSLSVIQLQASFVLRATCLQCGHTAAAIHGASSSIGAQNLNTFASSSDGNWLTRHRVRWKSFTSSSVDAVRGGISSVSTFTVSIVCRLYQCSRGRINLCAT